MATHNSFERMQAVASALGSTAATARGVAKFLLGKVAPEVWRYHRDRAKAAIRAAVCPSAPLTVAQWQADCKRRKADPDAKRARHDKTFRRRYLAGLRRREVKALAFDGTTLAGLVQRIDSGAARKADLAECARLRSIVTGKECMPVVLPRVSSESHPLRSIRIDEQTARKLGDEINMRGKDATLRATIKASYGVHEDAYTDWSSGKPRGVRATHDNYVRSFGLIVSPTRLEAIFHTRAVTVELPDGFIWDRDDNGLRAVCADSRRDDCHPSAADLLRKDAAAHLVATIAANRQRREAMASQAAVEAATVAGVYVCLADSLRAGNCKAGTLSFAERHHLDAKRHYSAPELLAMANGDGNRVRLAVTAARLRHEREEKAGVCVLAEHRA